MNKYFRWPTWLILAAIVMVALIPTMPLFHSGKTMAVYAAASRGNTTPTITLSASIVRPQETITLSGQGFSANQSVGIFLDSTSFYQFTSLSSDGSGNISGSIQMPNSYILQGQHTVIAHEDYPNINASATVIMVPAIYSVIGRPGLPIQLSGAAFTANETVQIYWGNAGGSLEGSTTTDSSGNFSFSFQVPSGLAKGTYPVTIVRAQQKPAQVNTHVQVFPETMLSTPGIRSGQPVNIRLTGFLPNEYVTFSWNANGGQSIGYGNNTDSKGALKIQLYPPSAPPGSYLLTAKGQQSGEQLTNSLNVGSGITATSSNVGSTITITGGGFSANEIVNVYFQTKGNGVVPATTDSTGAFTVFLTLPTTYNPGTTYYLYASNSSGTEHTRAKYVILPPTLGAPSYVYYNEQIWFQFSNFAANETVSLIWNYQQPGQFTIGTVKTDSTGSFINFTINAPSTPDQNTVPVAAIGATSKLVSAVSILSYPTLLLNPATGTAGTQVQVTGGNFGSSEEVTLTFQGTTIASVMANAQGVFTTNFKAPAVKGPGNVTMQANGSSSGLTASALFNYIPKLTATPSIVKNGDIFVLAGTHFTANANVVITWANNPYNSFPVQTDINGSFSTTIIVQGLPSGTYSAMAQDFSSNIVVTIAVVVE